MQRDLRAADLIPMGEKGRGTLHGHYEAAHLANLIVAFWGIQPSDAAATVALVRGMSFQFTRPCPPDKPPMPSSEPDAPHLPGADPVDVMARAIEGVARRQAWLEAAGVSENEARAQEDNTGVPTLVVPESIWFRDSPPVVELRWSGRVDHYFDRKPHRCYAFRRSAEVSGNIIAFAAELLRTNPLWKPTLPVSSPVPAVPNAGQKNESAEGVPTPPTPTRGRQHARRSSARSSQPATAREIRATVEASQPTFASRPLTFLDFEKSESPSL